MGVVLYLTKNFFARPVFPVVARNCRGFWPALPEPRAVRRRWARHGWERRAVFWVALGAMFLIYLGMSFKSSIPPVYFFLHPSALCFSVTPWFARMFLTFYNRWK